MWSGLKRHWASGMMAVVLIIVVAIAWGIPHAIPARADNCGGAVAITNGGFESPDISPGGAREIAPEGWTGTGTVLLWGEGSRPDHATQFASVFRNATLSQTIYQPELAGFTVTITFAASGASTILLVMFQNHDQRVLVNPGFATYSVTVQVRADDFGPYVLGFAGIRGNSVDLDDVELMYAKPCPTPMPTGAPTVVPGEEVEITVTGDPRYPVVGSAALDIPGLSYVLGNRPDQGSVVIDPDGSFIYTAESRWAMFDQFIVLASNGTVIMVNVVLVIDPPVPSLNEFGQGDIRADDPTPQSTSILDDIEDDTCTRCD